MSLGLQKGDFFVAGGALGSDKPSYVQRPADEELFQLARSGKFCYVLNTRQMGKSSLMTRTNRRLRSQGVKTAIIDLTRIGTKDVTHNQWYLSILTELEYELKLSIDPETWWEEHSSLGVVHRFTNFLRDVVLTEIETQLVIFIDEIDTTLKLDFTDDFFAAIRATYNARARDPRFNRLTFVLLGVATPSDLIKDQVRTPFNTGKGINLREFSRSDARVLEEELERIYPKQGKKIFDRIFYWTNGHPYLTQKLCEATVSSDNHEWTESRIDNLVRDIFLTEGENQEENLQFVHTRITQSPLKAKLLALYLKIYRGKRIPEDEHSQVQNYLKLFGLVRVEDGSLRIRNEIYRQAFNSDWVKANTPVNWGQRFAISTPLLLLAGLILFGLFVFQRWGQTTDQSLADNYSKIIATTDDPREQLDTLAEYFMLADGKFKIQALSSYNQLTDEERIALFESDPSELESQLITVVKNVYIPLTPEQAVDNNLLEAMQSGLKRGGVAETVFAREIDWWLAGRFSTIDGDFGQAKDAYSRAIGINPDNPVTHFERGEVSIELGQFEDALKDFEATLTLNKGWQYHIQQKIETSSQLYDTLWSHQDRYFSLQAFVNTPTPTPTYTPIPTHTPIPTDTATPTAIPTATSTFTPTPVPLGEIIENFETPIKWELNSDPHGIFERSTVEKYNGNYSGELNYKFPGTGSDLVAFRAPKLLGEQPNQITAWVYGDGSGHYVSLYALDKKNERWHFTFGPVDHVGWKKMVADLNTQLSWPTAHITNDGWVSGPNNSFVEYPLTFEGLTLMYNKSKVTDTISPPLTGTIYIDDLTSVRSSSFLVPTPAPSATVTPVKINGTEINFSVDRDIIVVGQCVKLSWHVENAQSVYLQGRPEDGINSREECPRITTTYKLEVYPRVGKRYTSQVTVTVNPEPTPTPKPTIVITYQEAITVTEPASGENITKNSQLSWEWPEEPLRENEFFDVRVYRRYEDYAVSLNPIATMAVRDKTFTDVYDNSLLVCNYTYIWSVRISEAEGFTPDGKPRGFVGPRSPDSKASSFIWKDNC